IDNLDHLSPITQGTDEEIDYRISPTTRSIYTLEPEDLDNFVGPSHTSSFLSYDENTTQVQFPPCIPFPSSPFSKIRLDQPLPQLNTPPPNQLPRFLQNLNPVQYFQRTSLL
ncbi:13168_t:CDS:1, partial [Gigaspora margarita]